MMSSKKNLTPLGFPALALLDLAIQLSGGQRGSQTELFFLAEQLS